LDVSCARAGRVIKTEKTTRTMGVRLAERII
jgi:hypothetical protein